jgi:hypothetical protein
MGLKLEELPIEGIPLLLHPGVNVTKKFPSAFGFNLILPLSTE